MGSGKVPRRQPLQILFGFYQGHLGRRFIRPGYGSDFYPRDRRRQTLWRSRRGQCRSNEQQLPVIGARFPQFTPRLRTARCWGQEARHCLRNPLHRSSSRVRRCGALFRHLLLRLVGQLLLWLY